MSTSAAGNSDRQKTQTELEMEAGRKALERRSAQFAVPVAPKKTNGTTNVIPVSLDEMQFPKKPTQAFAALPKESLAEGIKQPEPNAGQTKQSDTNHWPDGQNDETEKPKKGILNTIEAIKRSGTTCTWDEFRQKEYWFGHADKSFDGEVSDAAVTVTRRNIKIKFKFYPGRDEMREAITNACHDNKSNPVLAYFDRLKWDQVPRLDKLAHKYLGADDTPLNAAISRKMMCAIVRRVKKPGCKFDHQWVLQGTQGIKKSMFCEDLAVFPDLYTDAGDLSGSIKDQMDIIQGKQIIEFPELAGYSRATRERNKASLSRKSDRARLSYAHYATDAPRRSVAVATTNEGQYLNDPTGERRYWHVAMTHYDRDAFLADKDQIYAEAVQREPAENLWLDIDELVTAHDAMVVTVKAPNELVDLLADVHGEAWMVNGKEEERVSTADIRITLGMTPADATRSHNIGQRIADAMKTLGWTKAPGTLRCHKDHPPMTGYTRPLPFGPRNAHTQPRDIGAEAQAASAADVTGGTILDQGLALGPRKRADP